MPGDEHVELGRVSGLYGVKGWVRIYSDTDPREQILDYSPWVLEREGDRRVVSLAGGKRHGKGIVAAIEGVDDRDTAAGLIGSRILVARSALPDPGAGTYYWHDLTGLLVRNTDGEELGRVDSFIETGANDVMVVVGADCRRLIPFVQPDVIRQVDCDAQVITVSWHAAD